MKIKPYIFDKNSIRDLQCISTLRLQFLWEDVLDTLTTLPKIRYVVMFELILADVFWSLFMIPFAIKLAIIFAIVTVVSIIVGLILYLKLPFRALDKLTEEDVEVSVAELSVPFLIAFTTSILLFILSFLIPISGDLCLLTVLTLYQLLFIYLRYRNVKTVLQEKLFYERLRRVKAI